MKDCVWDINNKKCMSSNCDLCKSKFEQVFDNEIPLNTLNEQKTCHYSVLTDAINLCRKIRIRKSCHYGGQAI